MLTQKQKLIRLDKVTCSQIGNIIGCGYGTQYEAYRAIKGLSEIKETEKMEWGNRLELEVAKKCSEVHNVFILRNNETVIKDGWICGTPDFYVVRDGKNEGLEVKTASEFMKKEWGDGDEIPLQYYLQCVGYMYLTGFEVWNLAVLIGGQTYRDYAIKRDLEREAKIITKLRQWYDTHIVKGVEPEMTLTDVQARYNESQSSVVEADDHISMCVEQIRELKQKENVLKAQQEELKAVVMTYMKDHDTLIANGKKAVTWKTQSRKSLDTKAMAKDFGDLSQYEKTTTSRIFRLAGEE